MNVPPRGAEFGDVGSAGRVLRFSSRCLARFQPDPQCLPRRFETWNFAWREGGEEEAGQASDVGSTGDGEQLLLPTEEGVRDSLQGQLRGKSSGPLRALLEEAE